MVTHGRVVETHLYHPVLDDSGLLEKRDSLRVFGVFRAYACTLQKG
jgi:hypothetical protein